MFAYSFQETYVYHGSVGNGGMENELGRKGKGTRFCQLSILPGGAILSNTNFYIANICPVQTSRTLAPPVELSATSDPSSGSLIHRGRARYLEPSVYCMSWRGTGEFTGMPT